MDNFKYLNSKNWTEILIVKEPFIWPEGEFADCAIQGVVMGVTLRMVRMSKYKFPYNKIETRLRSRKYRFEFDKSRYVEPWLDNSQKLDALWENLKERHRLQENDRKNAIYSKVC